MSLDNEVELSQPHVGAYIVVLLPEAVWPTGHIEDGT